MWSDAPFGHWVSGAGCISHSGGGTCLVETMVSEARARGSAYLALTPLDKDAASFLSHAGFHPMRCGWARWQKHKASRPQLLQTLHRASNERFTEDRIKILKVFCFEFFFVIVFSTGELFVFVVLVGSGGWVAGPLWLRRISPGKSLR